MFWLPIRKKLDPFDIESNDYEVLLSYYHDDEKIREFCETHNMSFEKLLNIVNDEYRRRQ